MIPASVLELPGRWRSTGLLAILLLMVLPAAPLMWRAATSLAGEQSLVGAGFGDALETSVALAFFVMTTTFLVGLPAGVLTALYEFPGRRLLLGLAVLPVLAPSFLWAIGWSQVASQFGPLESRVIHGFAGCVLVAASTTFPLVFLTALAACASLSRSQVDAARLARGEWCLLRHSIRYAAVPAMVAAILGGIITLSDPGPGQILGVRTAASEILISFAALHDYGLAGRQSIFLTVGVLLLAVPLAWLAAPRFGSAVLARQTAPLRRSPHAGLGGTTAIILSVLVLLGIVVPLLGLAMPLRQTSNFGMALSELQRTAENTLVYGLGAGAISVILALILAVCVGRDPRFRTIVIAGCLALICLPPALTALGIIQIAADAPAWTDPIMRSRFTVCLVLGIRFFPVAVIVCLRAWASTSPSWAHAAGISGVSLWRYLGRVAFPFLASSIFAAVVLVALLASAEVGTVLLLHPPGEASLPLALFTIMANAPEATVASLAVVYVAIAAALLLLFSALFGRECQ